MLPFLKRKQEASASLPPDSIVRTPDDGAEYDGLEAAMEELGGHLKSGNWREAADCFRSCIQIADSEPQDESNPEEIK